MKTIPDKRPHIRKNSRLTSKQGLMKGYISREHAMVVLNKKGAFPETGV